MAWITSTKKLLFYAIAGYLCLACFGKIWMYKSTYQSPLLGRENATRAAELNQSMKTGKAGNLGLHEPSEAETNETMRFDELMKGTQDERRATLKSACQRLYSKKPYAEENTYIHGHNLVSRRYKLVSCDIYKCGFTSWLGAILVMEGRFTVDDYVKKRIRGTRVINLGDQLRVGAIKSNEVKVQIWQESLKVITVRNPFSRLVSAYYNKMLTTSPGHSYLYKPMSQRINIQFRHLRHNVTERNQTGDGTATFEDFVNYLVTANNFKADPHWTPFQETCKPCDAQYNYIIKFDTLNDDMEYLKQKLNISEYHRKAVFPPGNYKTNNDLVEKTFKTVPKALARNLYEKYRNDFELFGYEMPSWLT